MTSEPTATEAADPRPADAPARLAAARRLRRLLGSSDVDRLYGTTGADATAVAMLAHTPRDTHDLEDGRSLVAAIEATWPDGSPDRARRETLRRWGRRTLWSTLGALGLLLLVTFVEALASGDGLDARGIGPAGAVVAIAVGLLFLTGAGLHAASALAGVRDDVARARLAVRWAADRPGQLDRGIPTVPPLGRLVGLGVVLCAVAWVLTLVVSGGAWAVRDPYTDDLAEQLWIGAALVLPPALSVALTVRTLAWHRSRAVAGEHLFLFADDGPGGGGDAATAWAERFLLVRTSGTPFGTLVRLEERAVHPLTVDLSAAELSRRHEAIESRSDGPDWVGSAAQSPIVTAWAPGSGEGDSAARTGIELRYRGGWYVADGRSGPDTVHLLIGPGSDPDGWLADVLPLFGERSGVDADSLVPLAPERVPEDQRAFHHWTRAL